MSDRSRTILSWNSKQGDSIFLIFDAVTSLSPEDTVDITEHPVEEGANVTDHARSQSGRLSIEAVISMSPNPVNDPDSILVNGGKNVSVAVRQDGGERRITLDIPTPPVQLSETGLITAGVAALKSAILGAPKALVKKPSVDAKQNVLISVVNRDDAGFSRVNKVYEQLLEVKDDHTLLGVSTLHREYFDMMIERIASPRVAGDGSSAKFQLDLKEVRTVGTRTVRAPKPVEPRAQAPKNNGAKNPKPDPDPKPKVSLAQQFVDALGKRGL